MADADVIVRHATSGLSAKNTYF